MDKIPAFWREHPFRKPKTYFHKSPIGNFYKKNFKDDTVHQLIGKYHINTSHIDNLLDCLRDKKNELRGPADTSLNILTRFARDFTLEQIYDFLPVLNYIDIFKEKSPKKYGMWEDRYQEIFEKFGNKVIEPLCLYLKNRKKDDSRLHVLFFLEKVVEVTCELTSEIDVVSRHMNDILRNKSPKGESLRMNAGFANLVKNLRLSKCLPALKKLFEQNLIEDVEEIFEIEFDEILLHVNGENALRKEFVQKNPLIRKCHHCDLPLVFCERKRNRDLERVCHDSWKGARPLWEKFLEHDLEDHEISTLIHHLDHLISTFDPHFRTLDVRIRDAYDMRSRCFFHQKKFSLAKFDYIMLLFYKLGTRKMIETGKDSRMKDLDSCYENEVNELLERFKEKVNATSSSSHLFSFDDPKNGRKVMRRSRFNLKHDNRETYAPPADFDPSSYRFYHFHGTNNTIETLDLSNKERIVTNLGEEDSKIISLVATRKNGGGLFTLSDTDERIREYKMNQESNSLEEIQKIFPNHLQSVDHMIIKEEDEHTKSNMMIITKSYSDAKVFEFVPSQNKYIFSFHVCGFRRMDDIYVYKNFLFCSGNHGQCRCYDLSKQTIVRCYLPTNIYIDHDKLTCLSCVANKSFVVCTYQDFSFSIFQFESGKELHRVRLGTSTFFVQKMEMFCKYNLVALSFKSGSIRIYDCCTGLCCVNLDDVHGMTPFRMRFVGMKSGDFLLKSAGMDKVITLTRFFGKRCCVCKKSGGNGIKLSACGRCKKVYYCGRECQVKDWKVHKKSCCSKK